MKETFTFNGKLNGREYTDLDEFIHAMKAMSDGDITDFSYSVESTRSLCGESDSKSDCGKIDCNENTCSDNDCNKTDCIKKVTDLSQTGPSDDEKANEMQRILNNSTLSTVEKDQIDSIISDFYNFAENLLCHFNSSASEDKTSESRLMFRPKDQLSRLRWKISRLGTVQRRVLHDMMYNNVSNMSNECILEVFKLIDKNNSSIEEASEYDRRYQKLYEDLNRGYQDDIDRIEAEYKRRRDDLSKEYSKVSDELEKYHSMSNFYDELCDIFKELPDLFSI